MIATIKKQISKEKLTESGKQFSMPMPTRRPQAAPESSAGMNMPADTLRPVVTTDIMKYSTKNTISGTTLYEPITRILDNSITTALKSSRSFFWYFLSFKLLYKGLTCSRKTLRLSYICKKKLCIILKFAWKRFQTDDLTTDLVSSFDSVFTVLLCSICDSYIRLCAIQN